MATASTLSEPLVPSDGTNEIVKGIRETLDASGAVYRITGAPGLGKTRVALETLRAAENAKDAAVYFNARVPGIELIY